MIDLLIGDLVQNHYGHLGQVVYCEENDLAVEIVWPSRGTQKHSIKNWFLLLKAEEVGAQLKKVSKAEDSGLINLPRPPAGQKYYLDLDPHYRAGDSDESASGDL